MDSCAIRSSRLAPALTFVAGLLVALLVARPAAAKKNGVTSTLFLPLNPPSCNACHSGGMPPTNMVTLTPSSNSITSAQQIMLTLTVPTINGSPGAAGFNLRSSQQGVFAVGGSDSASTQVLTGTNGWSEATHTAPKQGEPATFTVLWTPSSGTSGSVTFTAWGNAVNQSNTPAGDAAASTTAVVSVCTLVTWYHDADSDGYGNNGDTISSCTQPPGYVSNNTDCNDGAITIHPGAAESCNGVDDNCNGTPDEGLPTSTFYFDGDGDGYGKTDGTKVACSLAQAGPGYVANNADCDDSSPLVHPGATETCNGVDDNCAGGVDEGLPTSTFYFDGDGDGYGNPSATKIACSLAQAGGGYVTNNGDCNDTNGAIHPGATEICNGVDDDCNGTPDNGLAASTFYRDADGDGFGDAATTKAACSLAVAGPGWIADHTDCNDADKNIFPGAPEICGNGKDDNCNGIVDTDAPANSTFYKDADGDGYGAVASGTATACSPPAGYVSNNTDCNDADATIHPGATEVCNGRDDNCAGGVDEGLGTISCGDGACRTTIDACRGGVTQVCTPVCPDAGNSSDAALDGARPDVGATLDGAPDARGTIDVASEATADVGSPPGAEPVDDGAVVPDSRATEDAPVGPAKPDAHADAAAVDGASKPGANEDAGTGDNGGSCGCRLSRAPHPQVLPIGAALALLALLRRRKSR